MASATVKQQNGYTREQLVSILEVLAGRLSTVNHLLMRAQQAGEDYEVGVALDAAQAMVVSAGEMADNASGGGIIGDYVHWNFGPNFADLGKEVQHG